MPTNILYASTNPKIVTLPLFSGKVSAGFPSQADDYVKKTLDLNELLVRKSAAAFFVRTQDVLVSVKSSAQSGNAAADKG